MLRKSVVLLDGTIGVGKSTLGRGVAARLSGTFLDGDDFKIKGKPWYCSSLRTCRALLKASIVALGESDTVLIGRPVRCLDWVFFTRHFRSIGVNTLLVGLQAPYESITAEDRGRSFSLPELERMMEMIKEGYGARPYADICMRTDQHEIELNLDKLETNLRNRIAFGS